MAMKVGKLWVSYDDASDVLYVSMGEPRPALTHEENDGVLVRTDPKTGETVGVTILSYDRHFRHLADVSWLATRGLPAEMIHYLEERPQL
jgi:uncharacterized protein YuzE